MGQREILKVLEAKPYHWFSCLEISKLSGNSLPNIQVSIKNLVKYNVIERREAHKGKWGMYEYRFKKVKEVVAQ